MAAPGQNLKINGERLWESLMEMAKIGPGVAGGNNRQTVTDEDLPLASPQTTRQQQAKRTLSSRDARTGDAVRGAAKQFEGHQDNERLPRATSDRGTSPIHNKPMTTITLNMDNIDKVWKDGWLQTD